MSVVAELDANLQALRALKPPGVTKSKIAAITALCIENVESESVLVQKIFTQFKRTPATHKLGVLYVVDSVTRQWVDKARLAGQELAGADTPDGTFAAGVNRMTELLPMLMNDLISSAPEDQREKTSKLIDIWERGNTFPMTMLNDFKAKLNALPKVQSVIATPNSLPTDHIQIPTSLADVLGRGQQGMPQSHGSLSYPSIAQSSVSVAGVSNTQQQQYGRTQPPTAASASGASVPVLDEYQARALESIIPRHIQQDPVAFQKQLQTLQQLQAMNVPQEQWPLVLAALNAQQAPASQLPVPASQGTLGYGGLTQDAHHSQVGHYERSRSRSPNGRRDSPGYGPYGQIAYRQRSPVRVRSSSPSDNKDMIPLGQPKWTEHDPTLPANNIKVLSRTLFVGGATCTEDELRAIFNRFGNVQTCIAQPEKRHAFVKMCTRADAVNAKEKMENNRDADMLMRVRSTRWGVGFGPRDCSDYQTGVSIIPIERLTEADRKWVLTAEYGGTGGKPIETGLVMEEPDIEIGAGVSSKAISRRIGGPESGRRGAFRGNERGQRHGRPERQDAPPPNEHPVYSDPNMSPGLPPVPGFGYSFPGMPPSGMGGMPPYR